MVKLQDRVLVPWDLSSISAVAELVLLMGSVLFKDLGPPPPSQKCAKFKTILYLSYRG